MEEYELRPLSPSLSLFPNVSCPQSVIPFSCRMDRAIYLLFSLAHPSSLTHLTAIASCVPASASKTLSLQLNTILHPLCSPHSPSQPPTVRCPRTCAPPSPRQTTIFAPCRLSPLAGQSVQHIFLLPLMLLNTSRPSFAVVAVCLTHSHPEVLQT